MKDKFSYMLGVIVGQAVPIFILMYSAYDGYENFKHCRSIASDISLLFAFFAWRRIYLASLKIEDVQNYLVYKEWQAKLDTQES